LKVVGYDSSIQGHIGTVGENWYVTGSVFVWLDKAGRQTTGSVSQSSLEGFGGTETTQDIEIQVPDPSFSFFPQVVTTTTNGTTSNSSFYFSLTAKRSLSISSTIRTSAGSKAVSWKQDLSFKNIQNMTSEAFNQSLAMVATGSFSNSFSKVTTDYEYPINLFSAYIIAPSLATLSSVYTLIDRSLISSGVNTLPYLTGTSLGAESLTTRQNASSMYYWNETIVQGTSADSGITEQWFSFSGKPGNVKSGVQEFSRRLKEVNDYMTVDEEAWKTIGVPKTLVLPSVEGEPVV
jgi:hypothetical protein